jgi:hypothetical protein
VKKLVLAFSILLLLNSCKLETIVILDKATPNSIKPYPIKDSLANAIMFKFLNSDKPFWGREHENSDEYNIGDTVMCYFRPIKKK